MCVDDVSHQDWQALDRLIGVALLDDEVREQLLHQPSRGWLSSFALSERLSNCLQDIHATTLEEFALAILTCESRSS